MTCPRCHSLMIFDQFWHQGHDFSGFKCPMCGEIIDPVIMENRIKGPSGLGRKRDWNGQVKTRRSK